MMSSSIWRNNCVHSVCASVSCSDSACHPLISSIKFNIWEASDISSDCSSTKDHRCKYRRLAFILQGSRLSTQLAFSIA